MIGHCVQRVNWWREESTDPQLRDHCNDIDFNGTEQKLVCLRVVLVDRRVMADNIWYRRRCPNYGIFSIVQGIFEAVSFENLGVVIGGRENNFDEFRMPRVNLVLRVNEPGMTEGFFKLREVAFDGLS